MGPMAIKGSIQRPNATRRPLRSGLRAHRRNENVWSCMYMYYVTSQFKYVMIDISNESICSGCFGDPLLSADGGVARVTEKGGNVSGRSKS